MVRHLALIDGERARQLVIINSEIPGHRPPWIVEYQYAMKLPGAQLIFRQILKSRTFLRSPMGFGGCFSNLNLIDGEFREHFATRYVRSAAATAGMARYLTGLEWHSVDCLEKRHGELRMPVQMIWGEDDPTFPVTLARDMVSQFPDCRFTTIPAAKLLVYEEKPDRVAEAVLPFFAGGDA
jgi:pimeloyl-ACP methyl ester carboxylesterase